MNRQLQEKPETYVCIGRQGDFPSRLGKTVFVGEEEIAVFHLTDGRLFALQNRSPHRKGGPLCEGMVSGDLLYDPLYDWKINLLDGKVQAPDTGQVKTYPVKLDGGHVWIGL